MQRRPALFIFDVWVCAFFQKLFYPLCIAREGGSVEVGLARGVFCAVFNVFGVVFAEILRFEVSLRRVEGLFVLRDGGWHKCCSRRRRRVTPSAA
jgi:hypothetical protein